MKAYPDEILVSILARYHHLNGKMDIKPTQKEIYGVDHKKTSIDLPSSVSSIISHGVIHSTADEVIQNNTLFPLYRPFLSETQVEHIRRLMIEDGGNAVHLTSGIMASVVRMSGFLRMCPGCLTEDIQKYGEPYWHREHQLPGMITCSTHEIELITQCSECAEPFSASNTRDFILCPLYCGNGHDLSKQNSKIVDDRLLTISKGIAELFQVCQLGKIPVKIRELYVNQLNQLNLCTVHKRIRQKELHLKFLDMFKTDMLQKLGVTVPNGPDSWLSRIFRKPRYSFHPLLHSLVIQFLWGSVNSIPSHSHDVPFGSGPWPCLNKTANHYRELTIMEVKITRCTDTKRPVGSFKCTKCGFHYSRRGPDIAADDIFTYGRVKDFGYVWRDKADNLIENGGSIRSIARALNVDSATINLYIKKKREAKDVLQKSELGLRKTRFLQSIYDSVGNYSDVKQKNARDYRWLYRHDREWLQSVLPIRPKSVGKAHRVNWDQRDKQMAKEINQTILNLRMGSRKPGRITISRIGRSIGKLALLERYLDKLPLCQGILKINLETEEQHQIRKIDWAVQTIKQQGERPVRWRVLRQAGIRIIKTEDVERFMFAKIKEAFHDIETTVA